MRPDSTLLDHESRAADSTVALAERLRGQLMIAQETALKLARSAGNDLLKVQAESLAEDLRVLRIDDVEKGALWLAKEEADEAESAVEAAYPQDWRRAV